LDYTRDSPQELLWDCGGIAVRFAEAALKIAVVKAPGRVLLQVDDIGPGLRDEDIKRVGERFVRISVSAEDGNGLEVVDRSKDRRCARRQSSRFFVGRSSVA